MSDIKCTGLTLGAVLQKSKYNIGCLEVKYKDSRYDVYSYKYGDGIWGTTIDPLEGDNLEELVKTYGINAVEKAMEGEQVTVQVPMSQISEKYSIMDKEGNLLHASNTDLKSMVCDGSVTLPDGRKVDPDAPDSPLRKMGLI